MPVITETDALVEAAEIYFRDLFFIDDTNPFFSGCFSRQWVNALGEIVATGESGPFPFIPTIQFDAPWAGNVSELSGPGAKALLKCGKARWIGESHPFSRPYIVLVALSSEAVEQWNSIFGGAIAVEYCSSPSAAVDFVSKHPKVAAVVYRAIESESGTARFIADLADVGGYTGHVLCADQGVESILQQLSDYVLPVLV